jgi:predicted HNH restriction endonuclease
MPNVYEMQNTPSVAEYVGILTILGARVTERHRRIFRAHYNAPNRIATTTELASLANITGGQSIVNRLQGGLGHVLCDELGIEPQLRPDDSYRWWSVWSRGWKTPGGFVWQMLPKVAEALEQLGWIDLKELTSTTLGEAFETEVQTKTVKRKLEKPAGVKFPKAIKMQSTQYERDSNVKTWVLFTANGICECCGNAAPFTSVDGSPFLEVHHVRWLAKGGSDCVENTVALCPNCHREIHHGIESKALVEKLYKNVTRLIRE